MCVCVLAFTSVFCFYRRDRDNHDEAGDREHPFDAADSPSAPTTTARNVFYLLASDEHLWQPREDEDGCGVDEKDAEDEEDEESEEEKAAACMMMIQPVSSGS